MKKVRLFCFSYTGASASYYFAWNKSLANEIELLPIEMAGRGSRMDEEFYSTFQGAVEDLYCIIESKLDSPYILLGNCMGGILCYELAVKILQLNKPLPSHMIIIGQGAPEFCSEFVKLNNLSEQELIYKIRQMGGDKEHKLDDPEIASFFLPVLRADCRIFDSYKLKNVNKILSDITVIGGKRDPINNYDSFIKWDNYTDGSVNTILINEDHYFIESQASFIIETINNIVVNLP